MSVNCSLGSHLFSPMSAAARYIPAPLSKSRLAKARKSDRITASPTAARGLIKDMVSVMDAKDFDAVNAALKKGMSWLSLKQRHDGTFVASSHNLRCYQKAALAFALCGYPSRAAKAIAVIRDRYFMASGDLRTSEDYKYSDRPANLKAERARYLYTNGWICAASHMTWAFDVSYAVAEYMLQCQDQRSGGFFSRRLELSDGRQDIASTAAACLGLIFTGHTDQAKKGGDFLLTMRDLQDQQQRFFLSFISQ